METKECEISRTDTFLFVRRAQEKQHYWLSTKRCSNNNSYFTKHQASSHIFSSGSVGCRGICYWRRVSFMFTFFLRSIHLSSFNYSWLLHLFIYFSFFLSLLLVSSCLVPLHNGLSCYCIVVCCCISEALTNQQEYKDDIRKFPLGSLTAGVRHAERAVAGRTPFVVPLVTLRVVLFLSEF